MLIQRIAPQKTSTSGPDLVGETLALSRRCNGVSWAPGFLAGVVSTMGVWEIRVLLWKIVFSKYGPNDVPHPTDSSAVWSCRSPVKRWSLPLHSIESGTMTGSMTSLADRIMWKYQYFAHVSHCLYLAQELLLSFSWNAQSWDEIDLFETPTSRKWTSALFTRSFCNDGNVLYLCCSIP